MKKQAWNYQHKEQNHQCLHSLIICYIILFDINTTIITIIFIIKTDEYNNSNQTDMDEISLHGFYQEQNPFEFATSVQFEMSITACNCTPLHRHSPRYISTYAIRKFKSKNRSCRPVENLLMLDVILPVFWRFKFVFVLMCIFRCLALYICIVFVFVFMFVNSCHS